MAEAILKVYDLKEKLVGKKESNESCFPSLTWKQRIVGFLTCVAIGYLLDIFSYLLMVGGMGKSSTIRFAIFYSLGNLLSMFATSFLVGFKRQCKNMVKATRLIVTIIYLSSLIATLLVVFLVQNERLKRLIVLLLILVQMISYFWYTLSYIPFARSLCKKCMGTLLDM